MHVCVCVCVHVCVRVHVGMSAHTHLTLMHALCRVLPQHQREDVTARTPTETQGTPSVVEGTLTGVSKRWLSARHRATKGR